MIFIFYAVWVERGLHMLWLWGLASWFLVDLFGCGVCVVMRF